MDSKLKVFIDLIDLFDFDFDFFFKLMMFDIAILPGQSTLRHIQIHKYKTEKHTRHDTYKTIHLNNTNKSQTVW